MSQDVNEAKNALSALLSESLVPGECEALIAKLPEDRIESCAGALQTIEELIEAEKRKLELLLAHRRGLTEFVIRGA
jgi:hypothetical protein